MLNITTLVHGFAVYVQTETGRIFASILIFVVTALLVKLLQRRARSNWGGGGRLEFGGNRGNFVLAKNLILLIAIVLFISVWASKIAGAALSLAAIAGALLIVSKEFVTNILGSALLAISRPYRVGDYIEIDGISGRVIDSDMLATTLAESMEGSQITGRTVTVPHALLLVKPVKNLTATGHYVINLLKVISSPNENLLEQEALLLTAANLTCAAWQEDADKHLQHVESRELVILPSAEPRVIIEFKSIKETSLSLRYACRPNDKVWVEQAILRYYLANRTVTAKKDCPEED
jgi:small-conductance mechanosensitive channel